MRNSNIANQVKKPSMTTRAFPAFFLLAALLWGGAAQAANLYWDTNDTAAGFGNTVGTWGTGEDAWWTTDTTGGFSTGVTDTTTSADSLRVNQGNLNPFTMSVSGDVNALKVYVSANPVTINGPGTVHLYGSGSADPLFGDSGDFKIYMAADLVVEAAGGSTVYLVKGGGNNGQGNFSGSITSTNTVDLRINLIANRTISGSLNHFGTFTNDGPYNLKNRGMTVSGVIGSNVTDIIMQAGNPMHFTNSANAYTGDTIIQSSQLRTTTATTLPDTTKVRMFTGGILNLNFTGTDTVAGLYFDEVEQTAPGTWGAVGNALADNQSAFIIGTGLLNVATGPASAPVITNIEVLAGGDVVLTLDGPAAGLTAQQSDALGGFSDVASTPSGNTLTIDSSLVDPNADGADFFRVRN